VSELSGPFVSAPWTEIERAATIPGIDVASHTRTHPNLAMLAEDELESELADARLELAARIPGARPWLAWPYGRSSAAAERAAQRAGYEFALRVEGGTLLRREGRPPPFRLPRLNIPAGMSLAGFRLRAAGLLGR
jgi:peptidoglycan/xylan/chitin deacetylase (PgdA/CDA1 family)